MKVSNEDILHVDPIEQILSTNKGANEGTVTQIKRDALQGHYFDRCIVLTRIIEDRVNLLRLQTLKALYESFGHKPQGLDQMLGEIMDAVVYRMIMSGWTRQQLNEIYYALPYETAKVFGIKVSRKATNNELENN